MSESILDNYTEYKCMACGFSAYRNAVRWGDGYIQYCSICGGATTWKRYDLYIPAWDVGGFSKRVEISKKKGTKHNE